MLLAIDIGNTSITFGVLKGQKVIETFQVEAALNPEDLTKAVNKQVRAIKRACPVLDGVITCSVVPKVLKIVVASIRQILEQKPIVVGRDLKVPIKNRYINVQTN